MTLPSFQFSRDAKAANWFSRRHRSMEPHINTRDRRLEKKQYQEENRKLRQEEYNKLTPKQKLEKLDRGGYTAKKQREKLYKLV